VPPFHPPFGLQRVLQVRLMAGALHFIHYPVITTAVSKAKFTALV
jgi:hypothetical protein